MNIIKTTKKTSTILSKDKSRYLKENTTIREANLHNIILRSTE